ncbi:MAG: DUF3883 domain-containing protein, partial [Desulfovibrio sp.]|nr:DUF3883 domain-containing protein [Desulfovibrio sp.]
WNDHKPRAIRLERLGGEKDCASLSNVTVVFFSLRPQNESAYIVGWYKNATIYRYPQKFDGREIAGDQFYYSFKTLAKNGICIPVSQRVFEVPSAKKKAGGYGQNTIWYADRLPSFKAKVKKYIDNYQPESHQLPKIKTNSKNIDHKLLVEKNAVEAVKAYYEQLGFNVVSVEKDNMGWDLEASSQGGTGYLIEVKGLAGVDVSVQLTPNEYRALKKEHRKYILAICTDSLNEPKIHIFSIIKEGEDIYASDDDGNLLDFIESIAATAKIRQ